MSNIVAYDTETTGLSRRQNHVFSYATCSLTGETDVRRLDGSSVRRSMNLVHLENMWDDPNTILSMHYAKFDLGMTEALKRSNGKPFGRRWKNFHCTMLMSRILRNHHYSHGLDDLAWELMGYPKDDDKALKVYTKGAGDGAYMYVPEDLMTAYQESDVKRGALLTRLFLRLIKEAGPKVEKVYQTELDLLPVTLALEDVGVRLLQDQCVETITSLRQRAIDALDEMESITGERMKATTERFRDYLYEDLKMPVIKKTKSGLPAIDNDTLAELKFLTKHPALDPAMRYRAWTHGVSTLSGYLERSYKSPQGLIYPTINTCKAITLRESSEDPNLQNVDKDEGTVTTPYPIPARSCFGPHHEHVLYFVDFKGQEARIGIFYSGDPLALQVIRGSGPVSARYNHDIHTLGSTLFLGDIFTREHIKSPVRKLLRSGCKNAWFAKQYGATLPRLVETLQQPFNVVAAGCARFEAALPRLSNLLKDVSRVIYSEGRIQTEFGNYLYVPKSEAHVGVNYLIQCTGALMLKRAQVRVHHYLQQATGGEVKLMLPVHDELQILFPRKRLSEAKHIMRNVCRLMTDFQEADGLFVDPFVPFECEVSVATVDWAHKTEFNLN